MLIPYNGSNLCRGVQFHALYGMINANCGIFFFKSRDPRAVGRYFLSSLAAFLSNAVLSRLKINTL